jgi:hypothetical protein
VLRSKTKKRLASDASLIRRLCPDWSRQAPLNLKWVVFDPAEDRSRLSILAEGYFALQ